jgi:hypothetical protein
MNLSIKFKFDLVGMFWAITKPDDTVVTDNEMLTCIIINNKIWCRYIYVSPATPWNGYVPQQTAWG